MLQGKRFYLRWIWANGWSELLGLGGTLASGFVLFSGSGAGSVAAMLGGGLLLVVLGALLEGALVGYAQGRVLSSALRELRLRSWVAATTLGALIAWLLGMVPSTLASLGGSGEGGGEFEPGLLATIGLAAGLGLVLGPILGTPQYYVLRRFVPRAVIWIVANALAWALGMVIVFLGMGLTPASPAPALVALLLVGTCLTAGLAVGAVHGAFLLKLLSSSRSADSGAVGIELQATGEST